MVGGCDARIGSSVICSGFEPLDTLILVKHIIRVINVFCKICKSMLFMRFGSSFVYMLGKLMFALG